jgi:hypothetical protein
VFTPCLQARARSREREGGREREERRRVYALFTGKGKIEEKEERRRLYTLFTGKGKMATYLAKVGEWEAAMAAAADPAPPPVSCSAPAFRDCLDYFFPTIARLFPTIAWLFPSLAWRAV